MLFILCGLIGVGCIILALLLLIFSGGRGPDFLVASAIGFLVGFYFLVGARRDWVYQKRKRSPEVLAEAQKLQGFIDRFASEYELWSALETEYGSVEIHRGFTFLNGPVEVRQFTSKGFILRVFVKKAKIVGKHVDPIF
jgi:hypothetical protein